MKYVSFPQWMRRFAPGLALVSLMLVLMAPLAACGGGSSSGSNTPSSGPVNLTYWSWIPGMAKQVALFNQTHPTIHVTWSNVGSGSTEYNKLFTAIKALSGSASVASPGKSPSIILKPCRWLPTGKI